MAERNWPSLCPSPTDEFDAVVSQFGLMFFEDRAAALSEMWRVLKSGGHLAVAVWAALDEVPEICGHGRFG